MPLVLLPVNWMIFFMKCIGNSRTNWDESLFRGPTRSFADLHDSSSESADSLKTPESSRTDSGESAESQDFMWVRELTREFADPLVTPRTHRFRKFTVTQAPSGVSDPSSPSPGDFTVQTTPELLSVSVRFKSVLNFGKGRNIDFVSKDFHRSAELRLL